MTTSLNDSGVTFADGSVQANAQYTGFRNRVINGDMRVAQRGASGTVNGYAVDRWIFNFGGTSPTWGQFTDTAIGSYQLASYVTINGTAGCSSANFAQRIEALCCRDLAGQLVTVSYWAYQNTGSPMTVMTGLQYAATTDSWGSPTAITPPAGTLVPTAMWTKVTATFAVPSAATKGLQVLCFSQNPSAGAGVTLGLSFVQLELGSTATAFEQRPYGLELSLCQRYYQTLYAGSNGYSAGGQNCGGRVQFLVPMRTIPNATASSSSNTTAAGTVIDMITSSSLRYYATTSGSGGYEVTCLTTLSAEL